MKNIKKITFAALSLASVVALASCKSSRNSKTPTGSLNLTSNYATISRSDVADISVTYNEMYNKYRQNGYDTVVKELKKAVVRNYISDATYAKNYKSYNASFLSAIYGTSSLDSFKDLLDSEKEDLEEKVDSFKTTELSTYGVTITDDEVSALKSLISTIATLEKADLEKAISFPETIITKLVDQYSYSVALTNYSRDFVLNNYEKEKIYSYDDDKEITNSYQIDDEDIESSFKSTYYKYNQTKAIVVRFKSEAEAKKFKAKTDEKVGYSLTSETSEENAQKWYATLYNLYYTTETNISVENPFDSENEEKTVFYSDANNSHLSSNFSSDLETFVYDGLKDGEFITLPRNIDGQYYLVYRNKVNYYYGDGSGNDWDQVKNLTLEDLQTKLGIDFDYYKLTKYDGTEASTVSEYIKYKLIDGKASETLGDTLVTNILKHKSEIEIYDPVYENKFYNSYSDYYSLTSNFDNDKIFKIKVTLDNFTLGDDSDDTELAEYSYSVSDFFEYQDSIHGSEYATTLLEYKYLLNSDLTKILLDSEKDSYNDSAKSVVNSFKKNNTAYDKSMGLANYMVLNYGITCTDSDAQSVYAEYLKASDLVSKFKTYYGYFVTDTAGEHGTTFVDDNNLFANLKKFADRTKDQYYKISANHIIIQVCPEIPGTTEDPRKYRAELAKKDSALATKFDEAVERLTKLITNELSVISDESVDAMAKLVKTFNNVGYTYNLQSNEYNYKTWEDFKNAYPEFNLYLHSEDLGEITKSSASSYVEEFRTYLTDLVDKIEKDEALQDKINDDDEDGVLINPYSSEFSDLGYCLTEYGYHILNVYSYTEPTSCKFEYSSDTSSSSSDYKNWEHQKVTIDEKKSDDTSDDMIAYASGYSSDDYASIEQLFIYFYQSNSSVTGLKSSISTAVSTYFSAVKTRYTNGSFQNYRLLQQIYGFANYQDGNFTSLKFYNQDGSVNTSKLDTYSYYVTSVRTSVDSSKELEESDQFYGWFDLDWTSDLSKCENYYYDED